jgi:hypothetical protein
METAGTPVNVSLTARLLAPYVAVGLFWCLLQDAWPAILAYHVQILFWSRRSFRIPRRVPTRHLALALPAALTGPVLYVLLPVITRIDLPTWLQAHGLSGRSLLLMVPYFAIVHPVLEQVHWAPLRQRTWLAHPLFAGYHMLVLGSLVLPAWLALVFVVLTSASWVWLGMQQRTGSLTVAVLSHILADSGVVIVAWLGT